MALKKLVWVGTARRDLKALPPTAQEAIGYALYEAQLGQFPHNAKPLTGLSGVIEIVEDLNKNTYRAVYATKLGEYLYVLHVFQKKSKQGIKTPKEDIELIKQRLKLAKEFARGQK